MTMNRRQFLLLVAGAAAGCRTIKGPAAAAGPRIVNAGPAGDYAADGIYGRFRDQGFFVIRRSGQWSAVSAICTHKKCRLSAEADRTFFCPCHGSTFGPGGRVTKGPARRDLPVYPVTVNEQNELLVTVSTP
jgi:Rieske Fe-S protein